MSIEVVPVVPRPLSRFGRVVDEHRVHEAEHVAEETRQRLAGRVFWNVNSTARGGGVAEMLPSLVGYARAAEIDARWLVIEGSPEFFHITKRLHHALHGASGDGSPLGEDERAVYESAMHANMKELCALVRPRDVVVLHDPQTAGLAPYLLDLGVLVIWRCHIGHDLANEQTDLGWAFLRPYLDHVAALVFSREAYIPDWCDRARTAVIQPSIDVFSPKNQDLDEATVRAILVHAGLVAGPTGPGLPAFVREDGAPGRVDRRADIVRMGPAPAWDAPLVVQVSRWDPLKDHLGVMRSFAEYVDGTAPDGTSLILAGPNVNAVADDPEGAAVFEELLAAWRELPHADRHRVQLANLPMADIEENAAIVNALQRHAAIVVQKSLREGFGLTVTEAMWKGRPIVASAVGGIQDQIEDGTHGLLLRDPSDLEACGGLIRRLLEDRRGAERLGRNARERVKDEYLGLRHLLQYADLIAKIEDGPGSVAGANTLDFVSRTARPNGADAPSGEAHAG